MRGESHRQLGQYLADKYMQDVPDRYIRVFLLGCIEPDRNPTTYLKGSLRFQWLRGHNYPNTRRFMQRIARRLERKHTWNLLDYYALGKLVHYIADSFTQAHNAHFPCDLAQHRSYEVSLQEYFLAFLKSSPSIDEKPCHTVMDTLSGLHSAYLAQNAGLHTDSRFALNACCCVLALLFVK